MQAVAKRLRASDCEQAGGDAILASVAVLPESDRVASVRLRCVARAWRRRVNVRATGFGEDAEFRARVGRWLA